MEGRGSKKGLGQGEEVSMTLEYIVLTYRGCDNDTYLCRRFYRMSVI
jgi:hypothetical protein